MSWCRSFHEITNILDHCGIDKGFTIQSEHPAKRVDGCCPSCQHDINIGALYVNYQHHTVLLCFRVSVRQAHHVDLERRTVYSYTMADCCCGLLHKRAEHASNHTRPSIVIDQESAAVRIVPSKVHAFWSIAWSNLEVCPPAKP